MAGKRSKPKRPIKPPPGPGRWILVRVAAKVMLALGFVVAVIAAVTYLGSAAGERVSQNKRYAVRVADIQCEAPPGTDRGTFLTEVRYLADLPEKVQVVDPELPAKLQAAFARHPWVAAVNRVQTDPNGTIRVELAFRVPVLAVSVVGEKEPRTVDKTAVLLPPGVAVGKLPLLSGPVLPPTKPAGEVWADPTVRRAAELAESYKPKAIEKTEKGWRLTRETGPPLLIGW